MAYPQRFAYRFGLPLLSLGLTTFCVMGYLAVHVFMPEQFDAEYDDKSTLLLVIGPIIAVVMMVTWVKTRGLLTHLHRDGLRVVRRDRVETARWDEIAEVWRSIFSGPFPAGSTPPDKGHLAITTDGRRIALPGSIARGSELASTLDSEVARRLLPTVSSRIAAGESVTFGGWELSKSGIAVRTTSTMNMMLGKVSHENLTDVAFIPWSEVTQVLVEANGLRLRRPSGRNDLYMPWTSIPNVGVLMAMLEQLRVGCA